MKFNEERKLCIISEGFKRERKKKEVYRQEHTEAFHLILCSSSEKAVSFVLKAKLLYAFNNTFYIVFNKNNLSPLTFVSYNIFLCKEEKILLSRILNINFALANEIVLLSLLRHVSHQQQLVCIIGKGLFL